MSKKVTGNDLKKLIEEVLKEEQLNEFKVDITGTASTWKKKIFGKASGVPTKSDVETVAAFDGDSKNLEIDDFEIGFSTKSGDAMHDKYKKGYSKAAKKVTKDLIDDPYKKAVAAIANDIKTARGTKKSSSGGTIVDPDEFKVGSTTKANQGLDVYEPNSIAFGQMANIGMQNSNPTNNVGAIQLGIGTAMKEFFKNKTTFKSRIDALNTYTEGIFKTGSLPNDMKKLLQATLISDYLSTIVTEMDSGSGAYNFESFLAALAGGSVTGKAGEPDLSEGTGQMGATDFVTADGSMGSAKYYSNGSGLTQAISNFQNKKGKTTLYVIAIKKSDTEGNTVSGAKTTSDPTKIKVLDIYLVSVMPTTKKPGEIASDWSIKINGEDAGGGTFTANKIVVSASDKGSIADATPIKLYISGGPNKTLKKQLNELTKNDSTNIEKAYQRFQSLFANLTAANQNAQAYASDGDTAKGEKAMLTLQNSDKQLLDLVDLITKDQSQTLDRTARTIKEQKITADFLKKLISESFKR